MTEPKVGQVWESYVTDRNGVIRRRRVNALRNGLVWYWSYPVTNGFGLWKPRTQRSDCSLKRWNRWAIKATLVRDAD